MEAGRGVDVGAHRVREPELVTQPPGDAVREAGPRPEDVVHHDERGIVRVSALDPQVAEVEVDLLTVGWERPEAAPESGEPGRLAARQRAHLPARELAREEPVDLVGIDVAAHADDAALPQPVGPVVRAQVLGRETGDRLDAAVRRSTEPVLAVHELAEHLGDLRARIVALDEEPRQQPLLLADDGLVRVRGRGEQLGDHLDEQLPRARGDRSAHPAGITRDVPALRLEQVGEFGFGVTLRPLVDQAPGEVREALLPWRVERGAAAHRRADGGHRTPGAR